ncbi:MAG: PQQ-binding-like beta-propeller repeat protein [Hyphomicrobium sp.]
MTRSVSLSLVLISLSSLTFFLGGCSDSLPSLPKIGDLNPFKEKQTPLPGRRFEILPSTEKIGGELAEAAAPIILPPPFINQDWSQPGGFASNAPIHLALSGPMRELWRVSAGKGSSKIGRVTASPIVFSGNIYTLDAEGNVSAFSSATGSTLWTQRLEPTAPKISEGSGFSFPTGSIFSLGGSDGGGYGGGLAADKERLYGASGFGSVIAMDPLSGKRLWEKNLGAPIHSSPTAASDRLFVQTTEGRFYCLSGIDGTEIWSSRGLPQQANLSLNPSPAVDEETVAVPYPNGDVIGLKVLDGTPVWSESLMRTRTSSQFASLTDAARPVIYEGVLYAIGHAGRMVATNAKTGERIWSINAPGTQMPWVAGDTIFVVDTQGQLMALSKRDGKIIWTIKLSSNGVWSGPILANNTLWLVSSKGSLASVNPITGTLLAQQNIGSGSYIAPIVANERMYILTNDAKLIAYN